MSDVDRDNDGSDNDAPVSAIAPTVAITTDERYVPGTTNASLRHTRTHVVDAYATPSQPPGPLPEVGSTVGHYVLVQKLGEGAHGSVYRAHRVGLEEHRVALKIMPVTRERLPLVRQELVTLAQVVHPNIVQLSDHNVEADYAWFTMPFYEGTPLDQRLSQRFAEKETLSLEEAYEIFSPLAGALAALHAAGFRHQDIKPENVFLAKFADKEHPILLDLGVAVNKENQKFLAGTREYFAPEQLAAFLHAMHIRPLEKQPVLDEKMDVYGLAVTLLLALVGPDLAPGARLLRRDSADMPLEEVHHEIEKAQVARATEPLPPKALKGLRGAPRQEIEHALRRWMSRRPEERPDAATMARELRVLLAQKRWQEARRRRYARVGLALAPVLMIGAPAAYAGGRYAVSLRECKDIVAADAIKSGQAAHTLQECQAQADGLIQNEKQCNTDLSKERAERASFEKDMGGKLSSCTNADTQLKNLLAVTTTDRDTAQKAQKECAASLAKDEDDLKACNAAKADLDAQRAKCTGDLTKAQGDLAKAQGDAEKCTTDLASCKGEVAKDSAELAKAAECTKSLSTCTSDLVQAKGSAQTCASDLANCKATTGTCPASLQTCQSQLALCLRRPPPQPPQ